MDELLYSPSVRPTLRIVRSYWKSAGHIPVSTGVFLALVLFCSGSPGVVDEVASPRQWCERAKESEDPNKAVEYFSRAIQLNPRLIDACVGRALKYLELGEVELGLNDLRYAIRLAPEDPAVYITRGVVYSEVLGDNEAALRDFSKAISLDSSSKQPFLNRACIYRAMGMHEKAIQDFSSAILLDPDSASIYSDRGIEYSRIRRHLKAVRDFDRAIELDPNDPSYYVNRAITYRHIRFEKQALADCARAIELDPAHAGAYFVSALIQTEIGESELAIENFYMSGLLYLNEGDSTLVKRCLARIREMDPKAPQATQLMRTRAGSVEALNDLGIALARQGQKGAAEIFRMAIEADRDYPDAHHNLAVFYFENGNYREALSEWEGLRSIDPEYPDLDRNLQLVRTKLRGLENESESQREGD